MVKHLGATDIAFLLASLCSSPGSEGVWHDDHQVFGCWFADAVGAEKPTAGGHDEWGRLVGARADDGGHPGRWGWPAAGGGPSAQLRRMQTSEFTIWLRPRTNKHHRPLQADTIAAYADAARPLSEWMSGQDIDGDVALAVLLRRLPQVLRQRGDSGRMLSEQAERLDVEREFLRRPVGLEGC